MVNKIVLYVASEELSTCINTENVYWILKEDEIQKEVHIVFRAQEPKAPVTYCDHALSGVRPSSVRRPLNYLHFRLLLQNRLMDFDETWYGWSTQGPLQVLLFIGQIRRGADPWRGKNRSRGVPFFKKLLLQTGRLQQQTECIAVI